MMIFEDGDLWEIGHEEGPLCGINVLLRKTPAFSISLCM
jgi:hypothetical protein